MATKYLYLVDVAFASKKPIKKIWTQGEYDQIFDLRKGHTYVKHFTMDVEPQVISDEWNEYVNDAYPWLKKE